MTKSFAAVITLILTSSLVLVGAWLLSRGTWRPSPRTGAIFSDFPPAGDYISPSSSSLLYLVDKNREVGTYAPTDLVGLDSLGAPDKFIRRPVFGPLRNLLNDLRATGVPIMIISAYRSYHEQKTLFQSYYRLYGEKADTFSARPGHSEHQLGLAVDFGVPGSPDNLTAAFADTPQGRWLAAHAWEYGFIQSYPEAKQSDTGYIYEPWHYRFVGLDAARQWWKSGLSLREFLRQNKR